MHRSRAFKFWIASYPRILGAFVWLLANATIGIGRAEEQSDKEHSQNEATTATKIQPNSIATAVQSLATITGQDVAQVQELFDALERTGMSQQETVLAISLQGNARAAAIEKERLESSANKFLGFDWGLGIGAVFDVDGNERIGSASVVDRIVRVDKETNNTARVFAEVHKFYAANDDKTRGHGPFVAVQSSSDDVVDSFAVGYMYGFRRSDTDTYSINVGIGPVLDPNVTVLGDGIQANQPVPQGESDETVRTKEEDKLGLGIFVSFSF